MRAEIERFIPAPEGRHKVQLLDIKAEYRRPYQAPPGTDRTEPCFVWKFELIETLMNATGLPFIHTEFTGRKYGPANAKLTKLANRVIPELKSLSQDAREKFMCEYDLDQLIGRTYQVDVSHSTNENGDVFANIVLETMTPLQEQRSMSESTAQTRPAPQVPGKRIGVEETQARYAAQILCAVEMTEVGFDMCLLTDPSALMDTVRSLWPEVSRTDREDITVQQWQDFRLAISVVDERGEGRSQRGLPKILFAAWSADREVPHAPDPFADEDTGPAAKELEQRRRSLDLDALTRIDPDKEEAGQGG